MKKAYRYSILYFLLFSLLLLVSSIMIFEDKMGFSYQGVLAYYQGNEAKFIVAKSLGGLLKVILPHIFSFGLFIMIILHFLIFTQISKAKHFHTLIVVTFFVSFLEIISPFFIINGIDFFAFVKLISFVLLEILIIYIFYLLFRSISKSILV